MVYQIQDMVERNFHLQLVLDFLHQVHKAVASLGESSSRAAEGDSSGIAVGDSQCLLHQLQC